MKKNKPTNTTTLSQSTDPYAMANHLGRTGEALNTHIELLQKGVDPVVAQAIASVAGLAEGGIEAMEAKGSEELVASSSIPTDFNRWTGVGAYPDSYMESIGFTLGPAFDDDALFRPCTLPEGWAKKGSDHSMHSSIIDELGRERMGMFYKAAFYDRRATLSFNTAITIPSTYDFSEENPGKERCYVTLNSITGEKILFDKVIDLPNKEDGYSKENYEAQEALRAEATAFLRENYPKYTSPEAYWDI